MNEKPEQKQAPFPNTFLIGVQKAGTTTLNDWLSQHPQVYCYNSLKDIPLFVKFPSREQLNKRLLLETPAYSGQQVVLHSAVNYIYYPSLLQKIASESPQAKLLLILRNLKSCIFASVRHAAATRCSLPCTRRTRRCPRG